MVLSTAKEPVLIALILHVIAVIADTTSSMPPPISPPAPRQLLPPLLASLPAAAVSPEPPTALLPTLSPILRQRVRLLSASSTDPWLPLLCYNQEKAGKLLEIAKSDRFEPHPVSGEVEIDWDSDVETKYRRLDAETLEAYVSLYPFDLSVKLLFCTGDQEGGGDGWRIGEVAVSEDHTLQSWQSIGEAEGHFKEATSKESTSQASKPPQPSIGINGNVHQFTEAENEDDDDAYWAQYDSTPARTPAPKHSPAPDTMRNNVRSQADEEAAYYAQYAQVQPAMDSHDPDEASATSQIESTLGESTGTSDHHRTHPLPRSNSDDEILHSSRAWSDSAHPQTQSQPLPYTSFSTASNPAEHEHESPESILIQPRPTSSSSSSSVSTVDKLEDKAAQLDRTAELEHIGVKQHISTSIKSLFRLARAAGMERDEFERMVRTELDVLALLEEDD